MQYLEVVLTHQSLPSGIGSLAQVGNGGMGSLGAPKKNPKVTKMAQDGNYVLSCFGSQVLQLLIIHDCLQ